VADYLVAYDITHPRRLARLYRALCKVAVPIEYSVFYLTSDPRQVVRILADLASLIDKRSDDLRCYPLPARGLKLHLGRAHFPSGIHYTDLPESWGDTSTQLTARHDVG
jgi:CRISPR-associated protein Cas2